MSASTPQIAASDIPDGMVSACPLHRGLVRTVSCFSCENFMGIGFLNPDPKIAFEDRHVVLCRYRRMVDIKRVKDI